MSFPRVVPALVAILALWASCGNSGNSRPEANGGSRSAGGAGGALGVGGMGGMAGGSALPASDGGADRSLTAGDATGGASDAVSESVDSSIADSSIPDSGIADSGAKDQACSAGPVLCNEEAAVPGTWYELAGSATGPGVALGSTECAAPFLALDAQTNPLVAWSGGIQTVYGIRFRHWTGTAWEDLGGSDSKSALICDDFGEAGGGVGVYSDGSPLVLCRSQPAEIRRWTGNAWAGLDQTTQGAVPGPYAFGRHEFLTMAMSATGNPVVAWSYQAALPSQQYYVNLEQWTGSAWQALGNSGSTAGLASASVAGPTVRVAIDIEGRPYISWFQLAPVVEHWNGASWDVLDSPTAGENTDGIGVASMAVLSDGRLAIALAADILPMPPGQNYLNSEVLVLVWSGSRWEGLDGSDQFGGITGPSTSGGGVVVADEKGRLTVAWEEAPGVIKLRRWNGHGWQQLGTSASSGGISQCATRCHLGDVAVRGARTCVVWVEEVGMVHLRCFTDPS
jgi:hypothetical protein